MNLGFKDVFSILQRRIDACRILSSGLGHIRTSTAAAADMLGNGFNDIQMFDAAQLSIAVLEREGMCAALLSHASVVVRSIEDGLDLLLKPDRLRATLRS